MPGVIVDFIMNGIFGAVLCFVAAIILLALWNTWPAMAVLVVVSFMGAGLIGYYRST